MIKIRKMRYCILLLLFLIGFAKTSIAQSIIEVDSVSYQLCDYLKTLETIENDTIKFVTLYRDGFSPILNNLEKSKAEQVNEQLYYRLQRNCVGFRDLLDRLEPPKEEVVRKRIKPETKISKKEIKAFKKNKYFRYFEVNGDTTKVEMDNNRWVDRFADLTYSKLKYEWTSDSEFILTFEESNNELRSNFSLKGDKFIYQLLEKASDHFVLSVNIEGQEVYDLVKLYVSEK